MNMRIRAGRRNFAAACIRLGLAASLAAVVTGCQLGSVLHGNGSAGASAKSPDAAAGSAAQIGYISGGGRFSIQPGSVATAAGSSAAFGWHAGLLYGNWFGDGVYVDYGIGLQLSVTRIAGIQVVGGDGTDSTGHLTGTREIWGTANTNLAGPLEFIVRLVDAGEPGGQDQFAIALEDSSGQVVYKASGSLGDPGAGNIQLHPGSSSDTAPAPAVNPPTSPF